MYCVIKISVFFNPLCVLMTCRKELFTSTVRCGLCVQERGSLPQMWTVCTREGITSTAICTLCVQERESVPLTDADWALAVRRAREQV